MNTSITIRFASLALALAVAGGAPAAEATKAADSAPRLTRVALFKNGLAYLQSEATLPDKADTVRLGQLPVPVYGTFWVTYPDEVKVRRLVTGLEELDDPSPVQNTAQLLKLNAGRDAFLVVASGDKETSVSGKILAVEDESRFREPPSPYRMDVRRPVDPYGRYMDYGTAFAPPQTVMLQTEAGVVAINAASIVRATVPGPGVVTTVARKLKRPSIRLELEKSAGGKRVDISCLARGLTWMPSYRIDLTDPKTARVRAKATILNEVADLDDVSLELVTGFPNIQFSEVLAPEGMSQNLADFLNSLAQGRTDNRGNRSHMMQQQAIMMNNFAFEADAFAGVALPGYSTAAGGASTEDLFFYPVKTFALKKGETACVPLFEADMPYRHLYTWRIGDWLDKDERYRPDAGRPDGKTAEEVWHVCRLANTLKMPLTTGVAEFVNDGRFAGQDTCYFTAPGTETTIRINRAMNLLAEQAEFEVERKRNAANFHGSNYDMVKVRGELKIRSRLDKAAAVEIVKELSGEVRETTGGAKDEPTARGLRQVNPRHTLTWELDLAAGASETLGYTYEVYIRN